MLKVDLIKQGTEAELRLDGRIDANTALELDKVLTDVAEQYDKVALNFARVPYTSSAGLRVLKKLQRAMADKNGELLLRNVRPEVMDVFRITGMAMIFNFE